MFYHKHIKLLKDNLISLLKYFIWLNFSIQTQIKKFIICVRQISIYSLCYMQCNVNQKHNGYHTQSKVDIIKKIG